MYLCERSSDLYEHSIQGTNKFIRVSWKPTPKPTHSRNTEGHQLVIFLRYLHVFIRLPYPEPTNFIMVKINKKISRVKKLLISTWDSHARHPSFTDTPTHRLTCNKDPLELKTQLHRFLCWFSSDFWIILELVPFIVFSHAYILSEVTMRFVNCYFPPKFTTYNVLFVFIWQHSVVFI